MLGHMSCGVFLHKQDYVMPDRLGKREMPD
ncbi:hypothetical protein SSE37_11054 [Sagittula stellata E-37]|uniref:Uncharacterized protein n=1 Tax=Sagittula stellata (strain ATCC 700073 / DSM 11524 / E-37) TaxID=388399 RepID=A3K3G3_SAGS3|nr:hypothetical protein SSE37_11054 [Sagittula stellata E-37]